MIGSTVSHDRILNKFSEGKRGEFPSPPWHGSIRHSSIVVLPDVPDNDTDQLAHIKRLAEFRQLKEQERR